MSGVQLPYDPRKKDFARSLRKDMSPPEKILWFEYLSNKKPAWRRQKIIGPFIADFYCPSLRMVLEIDGMIHDTQKQYDNERDIYMQAHGIEIVRIPARDIFENLDGVCAYLDNLFARDTSH